MERLFKWAGLLTSDGRRAWAFLAMLLGCGLMTALAAVAMYLVRGDVGLVFWLGLAAHVQVLVALTGFTAMFVKRDLEATKDGVKIKDTGDASDS